MEEKVGKRPVFFCNFTKHVNAIPSPITKDTSRISKRKIPDYLVYEVMDAGVSAVEKARPNGSLAHY